MSFNLKKHAEDLNIKCREFDDRISLNWQLCGCEGHEYFLISSYCRVCKQHIWGDIPLYGDEDDFRTLVRETELQVLKKTCDSGCTHFNGLVV